MRSPLPIGFVALFALILVAALPSQAQVTDPGCTLDAAPVATAAPVPPALLEDDPELRMGGQCGAGETLHKCDVQDACTGRHFKDSICCPSGTTGDCLVAVNGLGCVESVTAVCIAD